MPPYPRASPIRSRRAHELQARQVNHGPAGRVFAGNPLGKIQCQDARDCRYRELRVKDFSGHVECIERYADSRCVRSRQKKGNDRNRDAQGKKYCNALMEPYYALIIILL